MGALIQAFLPVRRSRILHCLTKGTNTMTTHNTLNTIIESAINIDELAAFAAATPAVHDVVGALADAGIDPRLAQLAETGLPAAALNHIEFVAVNTGRSAKWNEIKAFGRTFPILAKDSTIVSVINSNTVTIQFDSAFSHSDDEDSVIGLVGGKYTIMVQRANEASKWVVYRVIRNPLNGQLARDYHPVNKQGENRQKATGLRSVVNGKFTVVYGSSVKHHAEALTAAGMREYAANAQAAQFLAGVSGREFKAGWTVYIVETENFSAEAEDIVAASQRRAAEYASRAEWNKYSLIAEMAVNPSFKLEISLDEVNAGRAFYQGANSQNMSDIRNAQRANRQDAKREREANRPVEKPVQDRGQTARQARQQKIDNLFKR